MFQKLGRIWPKRSAIFPRAAANHKGIRIRPRLEILEGRVVPATFVWNPQGGSTSWSLGSNWLDPSTGQQYLPAQIPGSSDDVYFNNTTGSNNDCLIDATNPTVNSLTIVAGYTSNIQLQKISTWNGNSLTTIEFTDAGAALVSAQEVSSSGTGAINVEDAFTWNDGQFKYININLEAGSTNTIESTSLVMELDGAAIINDGTLTWSSGNVATGDADSYGPSLLTNVGTFYETAAGTFGTANSGATLQNGGLMYKSGGTTSNVGMAFVNVGQFYVEAGVASFQDNAQQGTPPIGPGTTGTSSPLTCMCGGTLTLAEIYNVYGGVLSGVGTINGTIANSGGDLLVGYNEGSSDPPSTLTINGNYSQSSDLQTGKMEISIDSSGNASLLAVSGSVNIKGDLFVHNATYAEICSWEFMTYSSITGDFTNFYYDLGTWWYVPDQAYYYFLPNKTATYYSLDPVPL
jgi:hypothetical protein